MRETNNNNLHTQIDQLQSLQTALQDTERAQNNFTQAMRGTQNEFRSTSRLSDQFGRSLLGIASGALNARGALAGILNSLARSIFNTTFRSKSGGGVIQNIIQSLFNAKGNAFAGGHVVPFAKGGIVNGPTLFPMAGGRTGVMGEAGAEAILPLRRMANGRLGVEAGNGKGAGGTHVYLDARGADADAVARIERALQALNASVERRAIDAVSNRFDRDPAFIRGR